MEAPLISLDRARLGVISLQKKYTLSTKRRECPPIFVNFHYKKAPSHSSGPHRVVLPHPVRPFPFHCGTIFVGGDSQEWTAPCEKCGLPLTVISVSMLQKHYNSRKQRDELLSSAEQFYCEDAISSILPKKLGSQFFSRNRQPIIVHIPSKDPEAIAAEIKAATESTEFYVTKTPAGSMRAGDFSLSFDHLAENILEAIKQGMTLIPKAKARVESITLMASGIEMPPIWEKNAKEVHLTAEDIKGPAEPPAEQGEGEEEDSEEK